MEAPVTLMLINLAACLVLMTGGWLLSLALGRVTVVDSLWGPGFVIMAWLTLLLADGHGSRQWLLAVLVTLWGVRLAVYLTRRNHGRGEDPRYDAWRRQSGEAFRLHSLFKVFLLQALFMWVIGLAMQWGLHSPLPAHWTWTDAMGLLVWALGFGFEAVADAQLAAFKKEPANSGKVMDQGLWAWSRHPNYFGEALVWWGIFFIALATPHSAWTIISPLVISLVLVRMTGIPLTEKIILERRPAYRDYIRRTSAFFPWFPGKEES